MTPDAWYDEQSRLSPDAVESADFPQTRRGRTGYEESAVRAFLGLVHEEMLRLSSERASLWQEVQRLRRRMLGSQAAAGPAGLDTDDTRIRALRILLSAQRTADRYVADAQAYSGCLTDEDRRRLGQIMARVHGHAELMFQEPERPAAPAAED